MYEEDNNDIDSQLKHWQLVRRQNAIFYFARRHGYQRLGLQPIPALVASEYNGKEAIALTLLLRSLKRSEFANERWTLSDTSVELVRATDPKNAFKKEPYIVEVWFDGEQANAFPYTNWKRIYLQKEDESWYVTEGLVDYNGLYVIDYRGDKAYFTLFSTDAPRYGNKDYWTVHYNNMTLYPPPSSSRQLPGSSDVVLIDSDSSDEATDAGPYEESRRPYTPQQPEEAVQRIGQDQAVTSEGSGVRRGQGERRPQTRSPIKKAKADSTGQSGGPRGQGTGGGGRGGRGGGRQQQPTGSAPSAEEVGKRHRTVARGGLSKLERLQEEARDPPIILVQGQPNCLKCWRFRLKKYCHLYQSASTVFRWLSSDGSSIPHSRLLISFKTVTQRQIFLSNVTIPRQCKFSLGNLNAL